jgi:ClpP class serine protease
MDFSLSDVFWIFLVVSMLQPMLRQRAIAAQRTKLIRKLEAERGSRVILLVHRQETMGFLGIPLFKYIDIADAEQLIRAIQQTDPNQAIDLVLHTPGGLVLPSVQIARAIARHEGPVRAVVPHYAMSGGTLIALAADEIVMSEHAVLGPVDPQIGNFPAASLLRVLKRKSWDHIDDQTIILADQAEMAQTQVRETVIELLDNRLEPQARDQLATALSEGRWTHDYGISAAEARELGFPVSTDIPPEVVELMALYPQPLKQRPSVEYLPIPKRAPPTPPETAGPHQGRLKDRR